MAGDWVFRWDEAAGEVTVVDHTDAAVATRVASSYTDARDVALVVMEQAIRDALANDDAARAFEIVMSRLFYELIGRSV